jgi:hypothetical protein
MRSTLEAFNSTLEFELLRRVEVGAVVMVVIGKMNTISCAATGDALGLTGRGKRLRRAFSVVTSDYPRSGIRGSGFRPRQAT